MLVALLCVYVVSCEKIANEGTSDPSDVGGVNVVLRVSLYSQSALEVPARLARVEAREVCSRISYAVFDGENKVKSANQWVGDESFGMLSLTLPQGDYRFVVVAHNGLGNATITSPEKITFTNNKCTDTYYAYQEFSVTEDTAMDVTLRRAVAKVRFVVEDPIPSEVSQMKFYYTGGSSTLDAVTGYGCVNSKQTEYREVAENMWQGGGKFDLFTFPHVEKDTIKMTISAMMADDKIVHERVFNAIPVMRNSITQYSGTFFGSSESEGDLDYHFEVDTTWVQLSKYSY